MNKTASKLIGPLMLFILCLWAQNASAALLIKITHGSKAALPIAIIPFSWEVPNESPPADNIDTIIENDLHNSGSFSPIPREIFLSMPHKLEEVQFGDWKILGVNNIVIGQLLPSDEEGHYEVHFRLLDTFSQKQLVGKHFKFPAYQLRDVAHKISNIIFEELTGQRGAFATKIVYVSVEGNPRRPDYKLITADADGHNPVYIFKYREPVLSPAWSPDGKKLAYVSLEHQRSEIFIQDVTSGDRQKIASFKGINGAPVWSPDGNTMALALSKDGNLEIYTYSLVTKKLKRLTRNLNIDTEPTWMPDGKSLIFTSDRSGRPQLYTVNAKGGTAKRLTFEGLANAEADVSPDGKSIAFVHRAQKKYQIAVMDLKDKNIRIITSGSLDESPSFSPNGSMIIYASQDGEKGILAAVSPDGEIQKTLSIQEGSVREPDWSPFSH